MAKRDSITISGNTAGTYIATATRRHDGQNYAGTVFFSGTFGSGTYTLNMSPDNGTTLFPMKDVNGTAISVTAAGSFNFWVMGDGNKVLAPADEITLWVVATGSTTPAVVVALYDNR